MSAKDPFSILYKETNAKPVTAQAEKAKKVERYRPGKAPVWPLESDPEVSHITIPSSAIEIGKISLHPSSSPKYLSPPPSPPPLPTTLSLYPSEDYQALPTTNIRSKPQFVSKSKRITHIQREVAKEEEEEMLKQLKEIHEEKKNRTKVIVAEVILKEEIGDLDLIEENEEDEEAEDSGEEFTLWKIREIKRIMRDKEEREMVQKEREEIERRRGLSDWERKEEDDRLGNDESAKPSKQKIAFMQKYYNKGVYYIQRDQDGKLPEIFMRDYNAPVEGDYDKSTLPKILQKRRGEFGKKGQSKYTHLTNEDTTNFDPLYMPQQELLIKQQMKGAGFKSMNEFDAKKSK